MSQSPLELEILYDREYQARHLEADEIRIGIEKQIGGWQVVLVEAEKKIFELRDELAGARKNVEEIEAYRRRPCVVSGAEGDGDNHTVVRMLRKIDEAIITIDDMISSDIDVPVSIVMHLESLIALPQDARSDVAASAYTELCRHVDQMGLDREQFARLDKQLLDVVSLACCRFIDATDKVEWRKQASVAFHGKCDTATSSKLGNSWFQMFKRDLIANPMRAPGHKVPEEDERCRRVRKRVHPRYKRTRCTSEPISESRSVSLL